MVEDVGDSGLPVDEPEVGQKRKRCEPKASPKKGKAKAKASPKGKAKAKASLKGKANAKASIDSEDADAEQPDHLGCADEAGDCELQNMVDIEDDIVLEVKAKAKASPKGKAKAQARPKATPQRWQHRNSGGT